MRKRKAKASVASSCHADPETRTIYLSGDVTLRMASRFRRLFQAIDSTRTSKPIVVEIATHGGDEDAGLLIMDTIMGSSSTVVTRATGPTMSMGAMILVAGDTRQATPLAQIMVHQGHFTLKSRMEDAGNELAELHRWEDKCWAVLDERTAKPGGYWKALCAGRNLYLNAAEALAQGLIDEVYTGARHGKR